MRWGTIDEAKRLAAAPAPDDIAPTAYNWVAITALVLAPITFGTIGLLFGFAALYVAHRGWATNRTTAIWSIVLNILVALISLAITVLAGWALWTVAEREFTNPQVLRQGHCVAEPAGIELLAAVDVVACDEPHWGQIFGVGTLYDESVSTTESRRTQAEGRCLALFSKIELLHAHGGPEDVYVFVVNPGRRGHIEDAYFVCVIVGEGTPLPEP